MMIDISQELFSERLLLKGKCELSDEAATATANSHVRVAETKAAWCCLGMICVVGA